MNSFAQMERLIEMVRMDNSMPKEAVDEILSKLHDVRVDMVILDSVAQTYYGFKVFSE